MNCLECGRDCKNNRSLGTHVRKQHGISIEDYYDKHNLRKTCNKCGIKLKIRYKGMGLCKKCNDHDRIGEKNPFFGKTHNREMVERNKIKLREISQSLWQDQEYRTKVVTAVSKPRRESFKKEQSERIKQWYADNPDQKNIRSNHMKKTWEDGKIQPNINSINESKLEREMFSLLLNMLNGYDVSKKTIRIGKKWFYPDVIINDKYIVEFYGTMWHADPSYYKYDDIVHHNKTASSIWDSDKERVEKFINNGYIVRVVWQRDFVENKEEQINKIKEWINEKEKNKPT